MRIGRSGGVCVALLAGVLLCGPAARAVSCVGSPAMSAAERNGLEAAARTLGQDISQDDTAALRQAVAPFLVQDFGQLVSFVDGLKPKLQGATITVDELYSLNARDLSANAEDVQFFCGNSTTPLLVTISLGSLPTGAYALALVHATGVKDPQQFALILQNTAGANLPPQWLLAGYFVRPLTLDGHSGLWFWEQARLLKKQGAALSAAMYYSTALYLSRAADIYTSNNFQRLQQESDALQPEGMSADNALVLNGPGGQPLKVVGFSTNSELGVLDLNVDVRVPQLGDEVASRTMAIAVMTALLAKNPDLRQTFHGVWVHASTPGGQTYLLEQPMTAIP